MAKRTVDKNTQEKIYRIIGKKYCIEDQKNQSMVGTSLSYSVRDFIHDTAPLGQQCSGGHYPKIEPMES